MTSKFSDLEPVCRFEVFTGSGRRRNGRLRRRRGSWRRAARIEAEQEHYESVAASVALVRFDVMVDDFKRLKTGMWASLKTKWLLAARCPELSKP